LSTFKLIEFGIYSIQVIIWLKPNSTAAYTNRQLKLTAIKTRRTLNQLDFIAVHFSEQPAPILSGD
jgi:hypothetical protein